MKSTLTFFYLVFSVCYTFAQIPQAISFQGVARDSQEGCLSNSSLNVTIRILDNPVNGNTLYEEEHDVTTDQNGLFYLQIGKGVRDTSQLAFPNIDWSTERWINPIINGTPMGTVPLMSVPYALYANNSTNAIGADTATYALESGSSSVVTTARLTGDGTPGNGLDIASLGATTGQVLKWDGAKWSPGVDSTGGGGGLNYIAGSGIDITGNVISNAGDADALDDITTSSLAGGDLSGVFPSPTVSGLQGNVISNSSPMVGEILKWTGTEWTPSTDNGTAYISGIGIQISGGIISNTGDTNPNDDIITGTPASGDLSGSYPSPTVTGLRGMMLASTVVNAQEGYVLKWNVTDQEWQAGTISVAGGSLITDIDGDTRVQVEASTDEDKIKFEAEGTEMMVIERHITGQALFNVNPSTNSVFLGRASGENSDLNGFNTAVGDSALSQTGLGGSIAEHGNNNTAVGSKALLANEIGYENVAIGSRALSENTGANRNTAVGAFALRDNQSGTQNTAIGNDALEHNVSGEFNTAVGAEALWDNLGSRNSALGRFALHGNQSGDFNTAVGEAALFDNLSGFGNTALGKSALSNNTSGSNNTALGYLAFNGINATSYTNSTAIGYDAEPTGSNQVQIGNSAVSSIGGFVNFTNLSDGRFKHSVLEDVRGLDFVLHLRPVTYQLNMKLLIGEQSEDGQDIHDPMLEESRRQKEEIRYSGFIAQEVEQVAQELGFDFSGVDKPDNPNDHYGLRYAEFVVPLVKAIQEQQETIEDLQARLAFLEALIMKNAQKINESSTH